MEFDKMFCEFCHKDGDESQSADGFCVECVTYFCTKCLKYHKKFHPNHTQQDSDNMPQDFYTHTCSEHSDELVKFYCLTCETKACSICIHNYHDGCKEIDHLPKLAKGFDKTKEFVDIENLIVEAEEEVDRIEKIIDDGREVVKHYNRDAKYALAKDREEINYLFDTLENEAGETETTDISKLDTEQGKLHLLKQSIQKLKSDMGNNIADAPKSEVFIAAKEAKAKCRSILRNLHGVRSNLEAAEITKYMYIPLEQNQQLTRHGKIIRKKEKVKHEDNVLVWSLLLLITGFIMDIFLFRATTTLQDINLPFEPQNLCYFSKDMIITTSFSDNTVHVVDVAKQTHTKIEQKISADICTSITTTEEYKVVIVPSNGNILLRNEEDITDRRRQRQGDITIRIKINGQHIVYKNNTFFVLFNGQKESQIVSYDMNGRQLTIIQLWKRFQILRPWSFAISPDNTTIYTTDADMIVSLTMDGHVQGIFRHDDLVRPTGMTTDSAGNLYVCGYLSNNVFKIEPDLSTGYELLNKGHGLNRPVSIALDERENELAVGSFGTKSIRVFKISQTWIQYIRSVFV